MTTKCHKIAFNSLRLSFIVIFPCKIHPSLLLCKVYFIDRISVLTMVHRQRQMFTRILLLQIFERILYIWAIRHPASGYVQGINDLVTPFFVVFSSEFVSEGKLFLILGERLDG